MYEKSRGRHHNSSVSTAYAALSIASWTGFPPPGTTDDATTPPTRIGPVATVVKRHPDNPNNRSRSGSHLMPALVQPPSRGRRPRARPLGREALAILALRKLHRQPCLCVSVPVRYR